MIAEEQNGLAWFAELLGNRRIATSLLLKTGISRVEPVADQATKIFSALLASCVGLVLDMAKEKLLREDATRRIDSKVDRRSMPVLQL